MSKHIRRTCLSSVALKIEDTTLIWMHISKQQEVSVNTKCYRKEILFSRCLLFIYLGLNTDYISAPIIFLHSLVDMVTASHNHLQGQVIKSW